MNDSAKGKQKLADSLVKAKTESSVKKAASPKKAAKPKQAASPKTTTKAKKATKKAATPAQQDNYQKVNRIWPD